ncbi:MAG: UvrD-helicase domain-containing protein [Negativicutes bacterium]|nr:UvrD-helicase domain-containing protein [Negativicutes bacterium]
MAAEFTPAQTRAIVSLATNVAVSAGAGAGKTRVLVERYINILRLKVAACDEILAITFTNKAAKEMKERIRAKAVQLAETAASTDERRFWQEVKGQLEYAPIGTFHSFCARALRENPVEAALDPNFAVLDGLEAGLLLDKAVAEVLQTGLAEEADWLDRLLGAYEKGLIDSLAPQIVDKLAGQGLLDEHLAERLSGPYRQALAGADGLKDRLTQLCRDLIVAKDLLKPGSAQAGRIERLAGNWSEVSAAIRAAGKDDDAPGSVLHQYLDPLDRRSKDKEIVSDIKETLVALDRVKVDRAALALIPDWCRLLLAIQAVMDRYKAEHRVLTFGDLEVRTARLLKDHAGVRRKYVGRLRQIMVDEFQDTNELQRQIVYMLAGGDADVLRGEKLFIVGDPKQSIYRFRGADVALFDRVRGDIAAGGGEIVDLDVNFRSMDGLLDLYNECFAAIMGTSDDPIAFQCLRAHRSTGAAGQVRAEFIAIDKGRLGDEETSREAEAAAIACRIKAMVVGRQRLIDHDSEPRAVRFGDIALLLRTMKDVDRYAWALQAAAVPYYIVGGRGFYNCQEVQDVLNLLRVVENRFQEAALAGVLRSPLFLLSDDTLLLLKNHGGTLWRGLEERAGLPEPAPGQRQAVEKAWRVLTGLRALRGTVAVADLIERGLEATGYQNFVLTQFMGQQKYANLTKMIGLARAYAGKGAVTLGDFLRYVAKLVAGEVQEGEAVIESEAGDTVKLMTIHKAKGLEYPVVFVADLQRKFKDETAPALIGADNSLGIKVPLDGELVATTPYREIAAAEKRLALLELKRLLYVALTRAKDYLVLSAAGDKVAKDKTYSELNSWLGWLGRVYGFADLADLPEHLSADKVPVLVNPAAAAASNELSPESVPAAVPQADPDQLERLIRNIAPLAAPTGRRRTFSATDIGKFRHCPRLFYYDFIADLPELSTDGPEDSTDGPGDSTGGPPAHLTGSVLHRCLELLEPGLSWQECLTEVVADKVPLRWRDALTATAAPLLKRFVASAFYRGAAELPLRKEWQFNYHMPDGDTAGGYHFTGRVDGLVDYGVSGYGIIDYKTDRVDAAGAAAKGREYNLQLVLYALAAEAVLGKPVVDAKLYFLRPDRAVAVPLDSSTRQEATAEMLAVCRQAASSSDEADYPCNLDWCSRCGYQTFCPKV